MASEEEGEEEREQANCQQREGEGQRQRQGSKEVASPKHRYNLWVNRRADTAIWQQEKEEAERNRRLGVDWADRYIHIHM